jgi:hypothetical protein
MPVALVLTGDDSKDVSRVDFGLTEEEVVVSNDSRPFTRLHFH